MELSVELSYETLLDDSLLDEAAAQGITAVSAPIEFVESEPKEKLRERASALAARGMRIDTSHPRFGLYNSADSLVNQYREQRLRYLEQLKDNFERMSILGVRTAPLHTGGCCLPGAPDWPLEMCAESIRRIEPAAADAGIVLAVENTFYYSPHRWDGGEFGPQRWDGGCGDARAPGAQPEQTVGLVYDDLSKLLKLVDQLNSPYVKICFDAGHAHYLGDLAADHALMGDRIALYHIHDNSRDKDMHLPPGYGTLNWELLGAIIKDNAAAFPAFIEAYPWARGSNAHMIRETNALLNGGRRGESRRCLACGHLILHDGGGEFCGCP